MAFPPKKRKMTHGEARQMFDNIYAREEAKREAAAEAFLRTPAGELGRQEFNRATVERLRAKKNPLEAADFHAQPGELTAGKELALYIINDSTLYKRQTLPIIANLKRKIKKGVYVPAKALILWKHLADSGAKLYHKEFGSPGTKWSGIFNVAARKAAAIELADYYTEHVQENPKKHRITYKHPLFGKRRKVGMTYGDERIRRIPTALEVNTMASSLALRSKTLNELITMYNKHRKMPSDNFIAKVIAEAAKQVAITKGARVKYK
jgi:hypothetical protein